MPKKLKKKYIYDKLTNDKIFFLARKQETEKVGIEGKNINAGFVYLFKGK